MPKASASSPSGGWGVEQQTYSSTPSRPRPRARRVDPSSSVLLLCVAVAALILTTVWVTRTEDRIPNLRVAAQPGQSAPGELQTIYPGQHSATEQALIFGGPWVSQVIGSVTTLASSDTAS